MVSFTEYADPQLVALYDTLNPFAADTAFYIRLASDLAATVVVDIGCGTGMLSSELAQRGHQVIGMDPSPAMLDVARHRPGGEKVRWTRDATTLADAQADLAIMAGRVAQIITDDETWLATLTAARSALRPGGHLAFDSENPQGRPWTSWSPRSSRRLLNDTIVGRIDTWRQLIDVVDDRVRYENHYLLASGATLVSRGEERFRSQSELVASLTSVGFDIEHVYGNWDRQSVSANQPELIVVAVRTG